MKVKELLEQAKAEIFEAKKRAAIETLKGYMMCQEEAEEGLAMLKQQMEELLDRDVNSFAFESLGYQDSVLEIKDFKGNPEKIR